MNISIRHTQFHQKEAILELYKKVAVIPGGIIRTLDDINEAYINHFLKHSLSNGLALVAIDEQENVLGEIHAYTPDLFAFRHLLTDLTIVVDPRYQGKGIGRQLFTTFLRKVQDNYPHILRVELFVRSQNIGSRNFYKQLGFIEEGAHRYKDLTASGELGTPIHAAWFNPNYSFEATKKVRPN